MRHDIIYGGRYITSLQLHRLNQVGECKLPSLGLGEPDCVRCPRYAKCDLPERQEDKVFDKILSLRETMLKSMQLMDQLIVGYRMGDQRGDPGKQSRDARSSIRLKIAKGIAKARGGS